MNMKLNNQLSCLSVIESLRKLPEAGFKGQSLAYVVFLQFL